MTALTFYDEAHLMVAAIRILTYRHKAPPTIESVCESLLFSAERGNLVLRKLEKLNIIRISEGAFKSRLFVENHLAIEDLLEMAPESSLEDEIRKFKDSQPDFEKKNSVVQRKTGRKAESHVR